MNIIKTIKDALLIASFFVFGVFVYQYTVSSKAAALYSSYEAHNYQSQKWFIVILGFSLIGTYWYLIKNVLIHFKSKNVLFILIAFSFLLCFSAVSLYLSQGKLTNEITAVFNEIPFPTAEDEVERNIKYAVIQYAEYLLISFFFTGLIGLVLGTFQLFLKQKTQIDLFHNSTTS